VVAQAGQSPPAAWVALAAGLAALVLIGVGVQYVQSKGFSVLLVGSQPAFGPSAAYATGLATVLLIVGTPALRGGSAAPQSGFLAAVLQDRLNAQDLAKMERGYYEDLLEAPRYTAALDAVRNQEPPGWERLWAAGQQKDRDDLMAFELYPDADTIYKEATFRTNRWAMRDRDYTLEKPEGTLRIAAIGASHSMGSGVEEEETFLALLEEDLNASRPLPFERYEVLNFSVAGYSLLQRREMFLQRAADFDPDALLIVIHEDEAEARLLGLRVGEVFLEQVHRPGLEGLAQVIDAMGFTPDMPREAVEARLVEHMQPLLEWTFEDLGRRATELGVVPMVAYIPETQKPPNSAGARAMLDAAERAGWVALDLFDAYEGAVPTEIRLRPWDTHPNVAGHRLLADHLYEALVGRAPDLTPHMAAAVADAPATGDDNDNDEEGDGDTSTDERRR
jgi:hypothetical protein